MCQFKSCIILKDRVFVPDYDSHSEMLEELNIKDTFENASNLFIRAEILPADGEFSDVMGWKFRVDQDILPDWYVPDMDESRAKEAVAEWMKVRTLSEGSHEVKDGVWFAFNDATVEAHDNATVEAFNDATVEAYDNATVRAYGNATVKAYGNATVEACNNATVKAFDNATVEAYEGATVIMPKYSLNSLDRITVNNGAIAIDHDTRTIKTANKWRVTQ